MPAPAQQVEDGQAVRVAHDRLAVDQAGSHRQFGDGCRGEREAIGEVIALAGVKGHAGGVALGENAEAVVLDFVNPAGPARRPLGRAGQAQGSRRLN